MAMDMDIIRICAEKALDAILKDTRVGFTTEFNSENKSLTLKLSESIDVCGYSALIQFMFMKDGEVYFFALFDELDITVENAALAFEASTTTALSVQSDDYLTIQLGAYLFAERNAGIIIQRYFNDLIYLLEEDNSTKELLARMH